MELRHLRYFVSVAEEENVSRAALKLHVSQPALSRQIRDLEDELGFQLLERSAKSVRLTESGRVFLEEARAVLRRVEDAVNAARTVATGGGELHVGYAPSLTARLLPPTLRAFQNEFPNVRVKLHDLSTEEMLTGVREKKLHIAFLAKPIKSALRGFEFVELFRDPICVALAPKHHLSRQKSIPVSVAAREPIIAYSSKEYPEAHEMLEKVFATGKIKFRIAEEHDSVSGLIAAVEAGNGIAVVTQSLTCTAGPRLKLAPLSPPPTPLVIVAVWLNAGFNAAAQQFLICAKRAALNA